jgi:hypothetical protein
MHPVNLTQILCSSVYSDDVGHAHPVKDSGRRGLGRVEIDVTININQTQVVSMTKQAGEDAEFDRTVSTDDQGQAVALDCCLYLFGHLGDNH